MRGRKARPINVLDFEKKSHMGRAEKEARRAAQIKLGDNNLKCPEHIAADPVALKKWNEIAGYSAAFPEYAELVTSTDAVTVAMFCQTHSEEQTLIKMRNKCEDHEKINLTRRLLSTRETLLKLARELFLTPASKIRTASHRKKDEADPLTAAGFGNV